MKNNLMVVLFLLLLSPLAFSQQVVLNEVMSLNAKTISDEDGDWPDWIELYNPSNQTLNLEGYALSDEAIKLKWIFPRMSLAPGAFLLLFASDKDRREKFNWVQMIGQGDPWSYRAGTSEPPSAWRNIDYNDSAWRVGPSGFGYGDDDDATVIQNNLSIYVRKTFELKTTDMPTRAVLHVDYDDGFAAYLNGQDIARANLGSHGEQIPFDRSADAGHEALIIQGMPPEAYEFESPASLFKVGKNVLALQIHNINTTSSDMSLIPFLSFGYLDDRPGSVPPAEVLKLSSQNLHCNFKLNAGGESLYLFNPEGLVVDSVAIPTLPQDIALGRVPDGSGEWQLLALPTPADWNRDSLFVGQSSPPIFSAAGGLYDEPVTLELADTSGAAIYYSLDGSEPDQDDYRYSKPLRLGTSIVVRARSFLDPLLPSRIITHTFLFDEQSTFATVCLSTNSQYLFDEESGLFEMGPNASQEYPYFGANFWQDWECPVHVEFFEPDGTPGFALDAGLKVFGGWSRGRPQKSLAIWQRDEYGDTSIDYQIFPEKPIDHFDSFLLRNGGNDWDGTLWRDGFMQRICQDYMNLETMAFRPAHIYLNGDYWGIMNLREKLNEHFVEANRGVDPDRVDFLDNAGTDEWMILAGSNKDYLELLNYLQSHDLADPRNYAHVDSLVDLDNFIDYQIAEIFIGNTDWPGNNIKYYRPQRLGGKWRWLIYDTDFGFHLYDTSYSHNTLAYALQDDGPSWPNPPWSTFLLRKFMENEYFKRLFINRFADHLNTTFDPERIHALLDYFEDLIEPEKERQRQRWPGSLGEYDGRLRRMRTFTDRRIDFVRTHIRSQFQLNGFIDIVIEKPVGGSGKIKVNSKTIDSFPWMGRYFQDIPIDITAIPAVGCRFTNWGNASVPDSMSFRYDSASDLTLTPLFQSAEPQHQVVINEIYYNGGRDFPSKDWIELFNPQEVSISLNGWIIRDEDAEHHYTFPSTAMLPAHGFLVVTADTLRSSRVYPG
ncbi:MAG: hypothetical protein EHM72_15470, partial [Calditrichaeota bacterium]